MRLSGKEVDVSRYGVEASWRQTVRILVSVLLAWFVAAVFGLHETIWALITALIVTQSSIAQTITTARDQIVGTLIGAVVGTLAISLRLLLDQYWLPFWLALVPLAALAAWRPSLRFAGVTLMIVYLLPSTGNPFTPLTERLAAIFLGVLVSVAVSYVVFHADARRRAFLIAAQMFRHLNELLQAALLRSENWRQLEARGELCVPLLAQLNDCVVEARRERITDLERRHPVLVVLPSLMRRVMSDTMLIARAIEAGKDSKGFDGVHRLHGDFSHAYRSLAHRCEQHAAGKATGTPERPGRDDVLASLPDLGRNALPEMHFAVNLLVEDLRQAIDVLMSDPGSDVAQLRARLGE